MSDHVENIGENEWQEKVERSVLPVLVDFWAPWCGPCKTVGPVIESVAKDSQGIVKVVKVNVDENPAIAARFGIQGIPTVMLFDQGKVVDTVVGARPRKDFETMIRKVTGVPAS